LREVEEPLRLIREHVVSLLAVLPRLLPPFCFKRVAHHRGGSDQVVVSSERLRLLLVISSERLRLLLVISRASQADKL
jgi:hypothetical protein